MKKILFYCQYLAGMGHLVRSSEIIRSLVTEFQVCLVNGGQPIEGFAMPAGAELVYLPPILEEAGELQSLDPTQPIAAVKQARKDLLLSTFERFQPDCVLIECFPFSKHKLKFELIPLLDRIQAAPQPIKTVCSLRDLIMTQTMTVAAQEKRYDKVRDLVNRYFDLVLVHSDPQLIRLEEQFPRLEQLNCEVYYTGYVSQAPAASGPIGEDDLILNQDTPLIVASAGGGRFGYELLEAVVKAANLLGEIPHQVQVFTGPFMPDAQVATLQAQAHGKVVIRRFTPHLLEYLERADLSISLGGYNTTMNILKTGVRSLIFPEAGVEQAGEQTIRAEKLAAQNLLQVLSRDDLQPELLAAKILAALRQPSISHCFDLQGASRSLQRLHELLYESAVAA